MSRTSFAALLQKYQSGNATPDERQVVEQWYALLKEEPRTLSPSEWNDLENRLWQKLQRNSFGQVEEITGQGEEITVKVIPFWQRRYIRAGVAASVILIMAFGYLFTRNAGSVEFITQQNEQGTERVANAGTDILPVALEDGSKVLLSPGAELHFPKHFAIEKREIFLSGEAFFEVSENSERPFLVNAGQITTKVLGTSFRIKAPHDGSKVEVSVKTGKVSVYEKGTGGIAQSNKHGNGVILSPNHQVTFRMKDKLFVTKLVENPMVVPGKGLQQHNSFNYNDTPLTTVLSQLEDAYIIELEVERKTLGDCPLTANLSQKGLYAQLDLICAAIQGTYEVKGTTILISGKGCE